MGTGEYLSMRSQKELYEYEIGVERRALADNPEDERLELKALFLGEASTKSWPTGSPIDLMKNPDLALRTHAREELGIDPSATGNPVGGGDLVVHLLLGRRVLAAWCPGS